MPVVLANLKPSLVAEIQQLVDSGQYASLAEFVELAAANQLELERSSRSPAGKEDAGPTEPVPSVRVSVTPRSTRHPASSSDRATTRDPRRVRELAREDVTAAIGRLRMPLNSSVSRELVFGPPTQSRKEIRIWGQVNRVLPLKVALRWLAVYALREKAWARVHDVFEQLASDAATIGTTLDQADRDRDRDELLSTGLPRRGNTLSMDRFLSQYLARTTRKGTIHEGAAVQYGLASLEDDRIALTAVGFEFAALENSVLDADLDAAVDTLSDHEREFFVTHAVPHLPSELHDFSIVLSLVHAGKNTPSDQLLELRPHLPEGWSDTMVRTHVSGVVARMVDLGLLSRVWHGRHVVYQTTALGSDFARTGPES